jgi:hypothetical protein
MSVDNCCEVISGLPQQDAAEAFPVVLPDGPQQDVSGAVIEDTLPPLATLA